MAKDEDPFVRLANELERLVHFDSDAEPRSNVRNVLLP
jgi:hypothetical protein